MNYLQNERNNSRRNIDLSNQRRQYNNIPINSNNNNQRGKSNEIRKGISLTPDRRIFLQNNSNSRQNNSNSSNNKFTSKINIRNFSVKKPEQNNPRLYDIGNIGEKINQKDNSHISYNNNEYSYNNNNNDYSIISRMSSNKSSVQTYLDRRHLESRQKINKLRHDKFNQESSELKFKPKISDNSKKIIQNLINKEKAVKINPTLLNRENYKNQENQNDSRISENRNHNQNQYDNSYNPNMKINQNNKYSQFDEYKKIVEKREMMQNNSQKNTIEVKRNLNKKKNLQLILF